MATVSDIFDQALRLSQKDRAELVQRLLHQLEADEVGSADNFQNEWADEIARRIAACERGEMPMEDWRVAMERLRTGLEQNPHP